MKTKSKPAATKAPAKEPTYPMHEKLKALGTNRAAVQRFIDWLYDEQEWQICEEMEYERGEYGDRLLPIMKRREDIMAEFFEIDLTMLDDEKRAMLDHIRKLNQE
jgi:hypothetical protein